MPRAYAPIANRAAQVTSLPRRADANVILYDGLSLNVDYGSCIAQHDVVYQAPAREHGQAMPLGDGDVGAMLFCPDRLEFQLNKSDLWSDSAGGGATSERRQLSAGSVSVCSEPSFLRDPTHYEQRLALQSGIVTIDSGNVHGACQVTAFVSASTGVLVVRYKDQSVRSLERHVDVALQRDAHLFALADTVGILQAFRDRRYALLARLTGSRCRAMQRGAHRSRLILNPARSCDFTLYVSVATSPRDGDPVAAARSRIETAIETGYDRLLAEQRQHWGRFWERSFVRLHGEDDDPLPGYLENLWYLGLYQQACCSGGFDAPLSSGGPFVSEEQAGIRPAVYSGQDIRAMLANLIPSNHLELSVPYVDTYFRLLPGLAARTGSECGSAGVRFPSTFDRFGEDLSGDGSTCTIPPVGQGQEADRSHPGGPGGGCAEADRARPASGRCDETYRPHPAGPASGDNGFSRPRETESALIARQVCQGLSAGLLVWEAWRHAPDRFFMCERVYPLLRAATVFALDQCLAVPQLWCDRDLAPRMAAALRALLWADAEYGLGEEMRTEWQHAAARLVNTAPCYPRELVPFGALERGDTIDVFRSLLNSTQQRASGFFSDAAGSPDLVFSARFCAGLTGILLAERMIAGDVGSPGTAVTPESDRTSTVVRAEIPCSYGGAAPAAIQAFPALPDTWGGAFTLAAAGGFRVSAEAAEGCARYVAVRSLLGGRCRVMNPWGAGVRARVLRHRTAMFDTDAAVIEFMTERNTAYLIEPCDRPLSRAVSVRLTGRPNRHPKSCGSLQLGIGPLSDPDSAIGAITRLPADATEAVVIVPASRIARAREKFFTG